MSFIAKETIDHSPVPFPTLKLPYLHQTNSPSLPLSLSLEDTTSAGSEHFW